MRLSELRAAIDREGPSPEARAVWWAIAAHADSDGNAWPNAAVIARMAGMSTRHVTNKLRELEKFGMVETTRMPTRRNRYHIATSAEPQFRFPTANVRNPGSAPRSGTPVPDIRNPSSGTTGTPVPKEVQKKVTLKAASTSSPNTNGSAATPLRGVGAECTNCRRPILFAALPSGRLVALDAEPDPSGLYAVLDGDRVVELGAYQTFATDSDVRGRLHRRHNDVCEQVAELGDLLGATRVNPWREQTRARKLHRETDR